MVGFVFIFIIVLNFVYMFLNCYFCFFFVNIYIKKNIDRCKVVLRYFKKKRSRIFKFMFNFS